MGYPSAPRRHGRTAAWLGRQRGRRSTAALGVELPESWANPGGCFGRRAPWLQASRPDETAQPRVCNSAPASMIKGSERKPTGQPRCEAVGRWGLGQWAGAVRIKRRQGRFRPDLPGSPITGAGLDPGVWTLGSVTLLVLPLESLPTALTVKGSGGGQTAGQPPIQQPGQNQTAQGPRDQRLKNQEGNLGGGDSRGERR
jgi:hypothetical protein